MLRGGYREMPTKTGSYAVMDRSTGFGGRSSPWRDEGGEVGGLFLFTEVISERKEAEQALRESYEEAKARPRRGRSRARRSRGRQPDERRISRAPRP